MFLNLTKFNQHNLDLVHQAKTLGLQGLPRWAKKGPSCVREHSALTTDTKGYRTLCVQIRSKGL